MFGYAGQLLRIDLGTGRSTAEPLPGEMTRRFLGGRGFVADLLYREVPPATEPFSPGNKVIVAAGPLSGVFLPGAGKLAFGAKSPATGGYGDSNVGGHLATELKLAGYDTVVLEGRCPEPTCLVVDDGRVEFRPAGRWWGKGALETEAGLKKELGEDFQIATIGPAGEKRVHFACVSHDFGRQAGRTGVGAVLGDKNVKAIAIRGTRTIPLADPAAVLELGKAMYRTCFSKPGFREWTPYGTAGVTDWVNEVGAFPTRNFQTSYFDDHRKINGQTLRERILVTDKGCFGCPIPCGKYSAGMAGTRQFRVEGPEYETIALLGGNCALGTIEEVAYANYVCDELGLDTISGGNVVGFAIEAFEKGLIKPSDVGGRTLAFGDLESVVYLLELIARREGLGDLLARGVRAAASELGPEAERFAIHVKGLEVSGYEPRYAPAMMLSYMTADVGAHHNRSWAITYDVAVGREKLEGKAARVIELQHVRPLFDSLGACRLQWVEIGFELEHYAPVLEAITGRRQSWEDLLRISERTWNLTRAFNCRAVPGFGRAHDYPPPRFAEEPVPSGPAKGRFIPREQLDKLLDDYYVLRGWNPEGWPTRAKLEALDLEEVANDLWPRKT